MVTSLQHFTVFLTLQSRCNFLLLKCLFFSFVGSQIVHIFIRAVKNAKFCIFSGSYFYKHFHTKNIPYFVFNILLWNLRKGPGYNISIEKMRIWQLQIWKEYSCLQPKGTSLCFNHRWKHHIFVETFTCSHQSLG